LAAAAQYSGAEGFRRLEVVSNQLAERGFLLSLFQPSTEDAKTLFNLVNAVRRQATPTGRIQAILGTLGGRAGGRAAQGAGLGGLLGAGPLLLAAGVAALLGWDARAGLLAAGVGGCVSGLVGFFLGRSLGSVESLPGLAANALAEESSFGLCQGHAPGAVAAKTGQLADWLAWAIDYVAGKTDEDTVASGASPLTIGELRSRKVELQAITSNLSEGQPYTLPFRKRSFLFREEDARRLFPPHVVEHLIACAYRGARDGDEHQRTLPAGFHFLPFDDDFPVVLAVRMSLSFPVLICAVPLYRLTGEGWGELREGRVPDPDRHFRRHWFSDGGLSSNFPIHFFDSWVPSRPTFGINLVAASDEGELPKPALQDANPRREADTWSRLAGPFGFLNAIWSTAQNYRDNMQSQLPSYRERIVPVALRASEGGLNLDMDPKLVENVMERGAEAGKALAAFDFDRHLWVRYLVLMKVLEENLVKFRGRVGSGRSQFHPLTERQVAALAAEAFPYHRNEAWCKSAAERITALEACLKAWEKTHFEEEAPRPTSTLRVTPDV
jgi:hypothetical protein